MPTIKVKKEDGSWGYVTTASGETSSIELDNTLKIEGMAADSKAVGDALIGLATETYVDDKISSIPTPDVSGQIENHNIDENSHNDIRQSISDVQVCLDDLATQASKHLMIDTEGSNETEPNGINADTLGGYAADEYMRKSQGLVEVNYSVVGGLTEPENPTQNMIWIQTETPIGRVFFGNSEPNETFMEGDVWICTGNGSNVAFNSLKIGDAYMNMVYPMIAKQYVSGVLVDLVANIYQNGVWVDWFYWLFSSNSNYIGEWVCYAYGPGPSYSGTTVMPTKTINSDGTMHVVSHAEGIAEGRSVIANTTRIDFSKYKTVHIKAHANGLTSASSSRRVAVVPSIIDNFETIVVGTDVIAGSEFDVYDVNVENYNGEGYVLITFYSNGVKNEVVVDSIWLN